MKLKLIPNLALVPDWREGWKFYSAWVYAIIIGLPELMTMLAASGYLEMGEVPDTMAMALRVVGIVGIAVRFIDQTKPAVPPEVPKQ